MNMQILSDKFLAAQNLTPLSMTSYLGFQPLYALLITLNWRHCFILGIFFIL